MSHYLHIFVNVSILFKHASVLLLFGYKYLNAIYFFIALVCHNTTASSVASNDKLAVLIVFEKDRPGRDLNILQYYWLQ